MLRSVEGFAQQTKENPNAGWQPQRPCWELGSSLPQMSVLHREVGCQATGVSGEWLLTAPLLRVEQEIGPSA